ncbi:MAG: tetratricopeptide repeat protein [Planctomycetota bacterium]
MKSARGSDEKQQQKEPPPILTENPELSTEASNLTLKQKIAALEKEEMKLIQELMRDFPNSDEALVLIAELYRRHGNSIEAVKYWEKALQVNPKRFDVYRAIGLVVFEKGQNEKAVTAWKKALEINPDIRGLRNNLALALQGLGKHTEAILELENEIQISPRSTLSHYLLGRAYLQLKEYDKAKKHYERVVELQPSHTQAYYGLAMVYTRLKQPNKAREYLSIFKKMKARIADFTKSRDKAEYGITVAPIALSAMAIGAEELYRARGDLQRAEELLRRAQTLDPTNTICLERLASLYQMSNRLPEALSQFEKIRKLQPKDPFCYLNIGILSHQLKRIVDAEKAFQKVIELAPKKSFGYRYLSRLYLRSNSRLAEARKLAEEAVRLEATADNYFILSWACDVHGDTASALAAIEQAMKLEPENPKYKQVYELIKKKN